MSNILKGIINEVNPHDYDSDWDYQDAVARSGKSRSSYRSQEDDTSDADIAYSKKMYQLAQKQKRDADHDRLATGTNEGLDDPWGDQGNFVGDKPVNVGGVSMKNIQTGDTVKYLGQPSTVVAMSKDRKHSRITISKGMGTVTQDVLTSDLQQLGQGKAIEENDNIQTRMRMDDYYKLADAIQEKLRQAIRLGDKERIQQLSKERDELDARITKYGLMPESEKLDELSNEKLAQYKTAAALDAGKADSEGDYKRGDKRFSGIVKATKKQFANDTKKSGISQGISEDRFNSKQEVINHFVKNGKSAAAGAAAWERGYRGSSPKKPIELKKPPQKSYHDELDDKRYSTFENLGDQLKSNSLDALIQVKLAIEKQREAEIEAWKQDFEKNTVQKAQQGLRREFQPTPVAQPGEKHSVLKARLVQLNNAIQKQQLLDKLVDRLERKGLMTPAMQNDTDTTMHVKYGAKDNYQSLNKKLDNAIQMLQNRLYIRKKSGLKEGHDERDEYDNPRQGRDYGKGNLFVDPGSTEFKKEVHIGSNDGERGRPKNLKGVSKALPADAFGRTTGKIPASARPTSKEDPFKELDEAQEIKFVLVVNGQDKFKFPTREQAIKVLNDFKAAFPKSNAKIEPRVISKTMYDEEKQRLDPKCWTGYKKQGTKMKGDTRVNNCVPIKETNSHILLGLQQVDEGWKEKLGAAALTGAMALGSAGANARVTPGDDPNINRLTGKPNVTQPVQAQTPAKVEAPKGFSKEYLQSVVNGTHPRPMISVEKAQELLKQGQGQ